MNRPFREHVGIRKKLMQTLGRVSSVSRALLLHLPVMLEGLLSLERMVCLSSSAPRAKSSFSLVSSSPQAGVSSRPRSLSVFLSLPSLTALFFLCMSLRRRQGSKSLSDHGGSSTDRRGRTGRGSVDFDPSTVGEDESHTLRETAVGRRIRRRHPTGHLTAKGVAELLGKS